jgi:hypothetical protein
MWHAWEGRGKPKEKRPLVSPRHRGEDGIRMVLKETGWRGAGGSELAQDRCRWQALVNMVMNLKLQIYFKYHVK